MKIKRNKKSFVEGKNAFLDNVPLKKNPYQFTTSEHMEWKSGWNEQKIIFDLLHKKLQKYERREY